MKDKKQKAELDKEFKVAEEVAESDDLGLDREALGDDKYIEALEEKLGQDQGHHFQPLLLPL